MLRDVVSKHIKPRLVPFRCQTSAVSTLTLQKGYGDYVFSNPSTGVLALAHRDGFSRTSLIFGCGNPADGGYIGNTNATGQTNNFSLTAFDEAGNAATSLTEGFCYGWDSTDLSISSPQRVDCTFGRPRIIWGKITGSSGAVAIGTGDFSCVRNSTGDYTVTFKRPFSQVPVVTVTAIATATATATIDQSGATRTASGVEIVVGDNTGSGVDADFYIVVVGQDTLSDSGKNRNFLQNSQRKPRIVVGQVLNTAGTWSWAVGSATGMLDFSATITDNGAGDATVTVSDLFKREAAVILTSTTQRAQLHTAYNATTGEIRFLTKAADGTNTDVSGVTNIFIIGSDDVSQY